MKLDIKTEICCEVCNDVCASTIECPKCNRWQYADSNGNPDIIEEAIECSSEGVRTIVTCHECDTKYKSIKDSENNYVS